MNADPATVVVKVRMRSHVYTSPAMPRADGLDLRNALQRRLRHVGDGPEFIDFTDRNGRLVQLRGREVTVVEVGVPYAEDDMGPHRRPHSQPNPAEIGAGSAGVAGGYGGVVQTNALFSRRDGDKTVALRAARRWS